MRVQPGKSSPFFTGALFSRLPEIENKLEELERRVLGVLQANLPLAMSVGSVALSVLAILLQAVRPNSGVYAAVPALVLGMAGVVIAFVGRHPEGRKAVIAGLVGVTLAASVLIGAWLVVLASGAIDASMVEPLSTAAHRAVARKAVALLPPAVTVGLLLIILKYILGGNRYGVSGGELMEMAGRVLKALLGRDSAGKGSFDVTIAPGAVILGEDRFLHTLIVGTTGTGKTSRVLKPMIEQDLLRIKNGERIGITVVEPKGDFSADVAEMARSLGIPVIFINPEDPDTPRFNPLEGDPLTVAEIMKTVLQSLFGKQEAFFRQVQEVMARNTVLLLKAAYGDNLDIKMMTEVLRNEELLLNCMQAVEQKERGPSSLTQYFRQEVLGKNKEEMFRHALGLRLQLEDITGNALLNRVLVGKSDVNLDRHLEGGGVLVVNTAMGRLGKLGDVFGQFIIMHFQYAVFRRPGNEHTRPYHVLYVDEFPRYVNPDFERLLAIGRSFRCATVLALQTTAQLLLESKPAFRDIVLENCRNKIVLNLGSAEDAKRLAAEFGERQVVQKSRTYKQEGPIALHLYPDSIREDEKFEPRFRYTDLMELKPFHAVVRLVERGQPLLPRVVKLELSEWDKRKMGIKSKIYDGYREENGEAGRSQPAAEVGAQNTEREDALKEEGSNKYSCGNGSSGTAVPGWMPKVLEELLKELPEDEKPRLLQNVIQSFRDAGTGTGSDGDTNRDVAGGNRAEEAKPAVTEIEEAGMEDTQSSADTDGGDRQENTEGKASGNSFFPI
ncbi:AAA-like domain-containing protein [Thermanaeromonas toyohensis ToBE]|uniref:AAA-like domain-containing protein n=1 Tax=Thermanaeromonas toyohensis ToBE TaxID=698762 RepID=A0A1W1VTY1_9FIRM|nr:AAA-like domain-containing protein [Thermanaeromonas toyohensis ToBE]